MDLSVVNVKLLVWLRAESCLCSCEDRLNVRALDGNTYGVVIFKQKIRSCSGSWRQSF